MAEEEEIDGQPETSEDEAFDGREPKSSRRWLAMIEDAERSYEDWQKKADNIDKVYASLTTLAGDGRDRQFQMFWANIQVLGPSIYSRPPVPVVVPRFKDRRPVPRMASELLERCAIVGFELEDIDGVMRQVRDDLAIPARGCAWIRYDTTDGQRICIDHANRKDFLHEAARTWKEVGWVSKRSWLTKPQMRKRFKKTSDDAYQDAAYEIRKNDDGDDDGQKKAGVWEIWSKTHNKVVWVTEGVDVVLDSGPPHLKLDGFFPCPKPAYSTVQRGTLIPVPDMLFYKDQLEEINELTARIGALADALQVRGFYPAGAGEIGDAIEAAIKSTENNQVLVPISNWAMVGQGGVKDMIVWLPIELVASTILQLVELRKQIIADVYEITGLSDIMRGLTDANETLGAQELKSQYGSVRIRDRQNELARFSRDIVRIYAEILAENFSPNTMLEMSQLEVETDAEIAKKARALEEQIRAIIQQVEAAKADPQMVQQAQQNPEQAQQMLAQAKQQAESLKGQIEKLKEVPTIEKVMKLLRDQRVRPYVLDIETDSTIAPDENAQKQRATELITAVGAFMAQAVPLTQAVPQAAPLMAETLKYVASQFRAGRALEGAIEEFADQMKQIGSQPKPPDPATIKAQGDAKAAEADAAEKQAGAQKSVLEAQSKSEDENLNRQIRAREALDASNERAASLADKRELANLQRQQAEQKHAQDMEIGAQQLEKLRLEIEGMKASALMPAEPATPQKPPSESISYKDLPPAAQAQMLAQAGISVSPSELAYHAQSVAASAAKSKEPA